MKKVILLLSCVQLLFSNVLFSQSAELNLDFEQIEDKNAKGWSYFGSDGYKAYVDENSQSGKHSLVIEYHEGDSDFKACSVSIPADYQGKKIKLTGYIKTEKVSDGWAGLWLRIDPQVAFDNMQSSGITGTTDWQQYEIELDLNPAKARKIVFGGLLSGKGKMWLDQLELTIDGVPYSEAPLKALQPAAKDKEFDNGSTIDIVDLNEQLITNLELLGRIWGHLKYYHPAIAKGDYNWDYELFRFLKPFLALEDAKARERAIIKWIDNLGPIASCSSCTEPAEDAFAKPDMDWIHKGIFGESLKEKLLHIYKNRNQAAHYYISLYPNVGNPEFTQEAPYENMPYPDDGFRLLAVYKLWNMIEYFFPYKHLMDESWDGMLGKFIPAFLNANDELAYEMAAVKMIGKIQDTHANLWRGGDQFKKYKGEKLPNIRVQFIEGKLVVTDFYDQAKKAATGLALGDVITKINNTKVEDIVKNKLPYYPASNYPTQLRDIAEDILASNEDQLNIHFLHNEEETAGQLMLYAPKEIGVYRWYRRDDKSRCYKMLDDNIGYITLKNITAADIPAIKETMKEAKGIIVDIRNYPSTFVVFSLGSFFTSEATEFVKFTGGNATHPGEFTFTPPLKLGEENPNAFTGKVMVLVNEYTQSQAEYTSMAFKAGNNTTIVGSTTAAADGNVSRISLPGGLMTMISGIGVYWPDGRETQRIGIVPDVEVKPSIAGIKAGNDEVLEKAIALIKQD